MQPQGGELSQGDNFSKLTGNKIRNDQISIILLKVLTAKNNAPEQNIY